MSKSDKRVNQNLLPENVAKTHFPEGLRVLAVDDNIVCLNILAALLQKCRYEVTTTTKATEALEMLRKNKENYDIVITDVIMHDMDGFELLEIIGLEMDIPVLMMSENDDPESVMKGVMHGARDYLLKPVRIEELKNIWQHVIRKSLFDPRKFNIMIGETDQNSMHLKRQREKRMEKEKVTNTESVGESCVQKKQRIVWTPELHKKFVAVVQLLEVDKAVPKKILELMNEPELTREIVANHLQSYRNVLRKEKSKTSLHAINRIGDHLGSNAEMVSFRDHHFSKTEIFSTPLVNQRPLFLPLNPQEMLLRQNMPPPNIYDQMRPSWPIPVPRNVRLAPSAPPLVGFAPYSYCPGAFNFAGTPLQMHGEAPSQMAPISQPNFLVEPFQSSFPGQNDHGRNLVSFSNYYQWNRRTLDFRGQTVGFQPPPETSERQSNAHHTMFGNNSAPQL